MPRSSSRSRSTSRPKQPAPAPAIQTPPPAHAAAPPPAASGGGGGMMSNMASSVVSGMGTGIGFSVASRAVDAVMGPRQTEVVHSHQDTPASYAQNQAAPLPPSPAPTSGNCRTQTDELNSCLSRGDATICQLQFDNLKQCQSGQTEFL